MTSVDIFYKVQTLQTHDILLSCSTSAEDYDLLAFVVGSSDIILYCLPHGSSSPIIRWVPWFDDVKKRVHSIVFHPVEGRWLLVCCNDASLYLIPALSLLNIGKHDDSERKSWHSNDITSIPVPLAINSDFVPSASAWWVRRNHKNELRDIVVLGSVSGLVVIFSLVNGSIILTTKVDGPVKRIEICDQDPHACIVITSEDSRQWKLKFQESVKESSEIHRPQSSESRGSKLLGLKQLSVDTFATIKQRLSETRSKSISAVLPVECTEGEAVCCAPQWQLSVKLQSSNESELSAHDRIMTASYPSNIVALENFKSETTTVHKLPFRNSNLVVLESFFILSDEKLNTIYVISQAFSQCRTDSNKHILNTDFNNESIIQVFNLNKHEEVLSIYCGNFHKYRCIIVTNMGIYSLAIRDDPRNIVMQHILKSDQMVSLAEKISFIFGLDVQHIICEAGDAHLLKGQINEAVKLYSLSRSGTMRSVVMLGKHGHVQDLLKILNNGNFSHSHKNHLGNLKILAYVHQYLTNYSEEIHAEFLDMLNKGGYDESLCVSVLAQAGLCTDLLLITKQRGLQPVTVAALANNIQRNYPLDISKCDGFWELMSETSLCEALLAKPVAAKLHLTFIQSRLFTLADDILKRLEELYNPFRNSLKPWITSSCQGEAPISLWVQTYLLICMHMSSRKNRQEIINIDNYVTYETIETAEEDAPAQVIGAGFNHAGVILHGNVYSWGASAHGCLGTGPSHSRIHPPALVDMFPSIGIRVSSLSCGRTHTLALTSNGVYAWGSNRYGQLGSPGVLQSWYPQRVNFFNDKNVCQISTGQYHSIAVDSRNQVYTWGWGVHGQLGQGNVEDYWEPIKVSLLSDKEITFASGGHAHSLFLDSNGRVWACGSSIFGQLGTGGNIKSSIPIQVFGLPEKIIDLATGYFHSVGLAEGGRVYQWGCSPSVLRAAAHAAKRRFRTHDSPDEGGIQVDDNLSYLSPTLVDTSHVVGKIVKVSVGHEHNAILTEDGTVYTWGRNMDGQLGNTADQFLRRSQHVLHPKPITVGTSVKDIKCGSDFTIAIDTIGQVWTWGANHHSVVANRTALASLEGEVVMVKNRSRVIKLPHSGTHTQPLPTLLTIPTQINDTSFLKGKQVVIHSDDWEVRMNVAIELLSQFYQSNELIEKCIELGEWNAGPKLARVKGDYLLAFKLHLHSNSTLDFVCRVLNEFLPLLSHATNQLENSLEEALNYWREHALPVDVFELIMNEHWSYIAKPLGEIFFKVNSTVEDMFPKLSPNFGLRLLSHSLAQNDKLLDCVLPGVETIKDAVTAVNMDSDYLDIDQNMAYDSIPLKVSVSDPVCCGSQGLRKPSLYLK